MKLNFSAVLISGAAAIALLFTPLALRAQTQGQPAHRSSGAMEQLNLTADQQTRLTQIRQNARSQIENLLTSEQREQFRSAIEQRKPFREAIAAANLTADQRTQMRSIFQSSRQESDAVLTADQRQQLQELMRSHRAEHRARQGSQQNQQQR